MNLYGFYFSDGKWALAAGGRKRDRIKQAQDRQALVCVMTNAYGYGSSSSFDAPTFKILSQFIADYRTA